MPPKLPHPYVRFSIEHGSEVATMMAADFRSAMLERDHEIGRLQLVLQAVLEQNGRFADELQKLRAVEGAARWIEEDGWTPVTREALYAALRAT